METPNIVKLYGNLLEEEAIARTRAGGHLSQEQIKKITDEFLEKNATQRLSDGIKVETIFHEPSEEDFKNGYSWSVKITVPPGLLDPEVEAEWRRKNELEKTKSEATRPKNQ